MKTIHTPIPSPSHCYSFACPSDKIAFFDIETTGLSPKASSLYLIGAMCYDSSRDEWLLTQWFADDYRSEAQIISAFLEYLEPFETLCHFNGATFDIPYVLSKCQKHQISPSSHCQGLLQNTSPHQAAFGNGAASIDLLKEIRPLKKKLHLLRANQTALEKWLGIFRTDQYDGGQLITVYADYMQKKILHSPEADELEHLLLLHNHDDMAGMLEICSILSYHDCLHPAAPPAVTNISQDENMLSISFALPCPVPKPVSLSHPFPATEDDAETKALLCLQDGTGTVSVPLYRGILKYFLSPSKDYFYLPEEDSAVHKSVALFVDPAFRRKATAATCYTKKEGTFIPSFAARTSPLNIPQFFHAHKSKPAYYLLEDILPDSRTEDKFQALSRYLLCEIPFF